MGTRYNVNMLKEKVIRRRTNSILVFVRHKQYFSTSKSFHIYSILLIFYFKTCYVPIVLDIIVIELKR